MSDDSGEKNRVFDDDLVAHAGTTLSRYCSIYDIGTPLPKNKHVYTFPLSAGHSWYD